MHRQFSTDKTIDGVVRALLRAGWIVKSRKKHTKIENPETSQCITVPGSPSDRRAVQNWLHQLRRSGIEVAAC